MKTLCPLLFLLLFSLNCAFAQSSLDWKGERKMGEKMLKEGKILAAAGHFEEAWRQKPQKTELAYQAGTLYLQIREYRRASEMLTAAKQNPAVLKKHPDTQYKLALALQQNGEFDEAIPEFLIYLNTYTGKDRELVIERVEEHINGSALGIRLVDAADKSIILEHLTETVNGTGDDFSPIAFSDDILYFSNRTTTNDLASTRIYRSQLLNGAWSAAEMPAFPIPKGTAFGNGCFTPDASRFYYTQLNSNKLSELWVIQRNGSEWAVPQRLRDYINPEGSSNTQPMVVWKNGTETLFFASDRKGGRGGFDIWSCTRDTKSKDIDFTLPENLGAIVNTSGDEVTPFYDLQDSTLYFASNGRITLGGLDIFKTKGINTRWTSPENMSAPFNSGADDYNFIKNKSRSGGFFVSNRAFGTEKINTVDDDIFAFTVQTRKELAIKGKVLDKNFQQPLSETQVLLYEIVGKDNQRLLTSATVDKTGAYLFPLLANKNYYIETEKDGYKSAAYNFNSPQQDTVEHTFQLEKYNAPIFTRIPDNKSESKPKEEVKKEEKITEINSQEKPTTKPNKPNKTKENNNGMTYKIQLMAYEQLDQLRLIRLQRVENLGRFDVEPVPNKPMRRTLLAEFGSLKETEQLLTKVKDKGFDDAFIVKYKDGVRQIK